jgi:hypothetical protein
MLLNNYAHNTCLLDLVYRHMKRGDERILYRRNVVGIVLFVS